MKPSQLRYLLSIGCVAIGAMAGWITASDIGPGPSIAEQTIVPSVSTTPAEPVSSPLTNSLQAPARGKVDATLEAAMSYPSALHRTAAMKRYFDALGDNDFPAAFSKIRDMAEESPEALNMLARAWAERDPETAARTLITLPEGTQRGRALSAFARAWGRKNPDAAIAWAEKNLAGRDLDTTRSYLKGRAAIVSPPPRKSLEEILTMTDSGERRGLLQRHFMDLANTNPADALQQAAQLKIKSERKSIEGTVAGNWALRDPAAFLQWLGAKETRAPSKGHSWTDWSGELTSASSQLLKKDPAMVRQLIAQFPEGQLKRSLANTYAAKLVQDDPEAALAFVEEFKSNDAEYSVSGILPELLAKDPAKGGKYFLRELEKHTAKNSRSAGEYASRIMKPLINKDVVAAASFAAAVPETAMPCVFYAVADVWCAKDGRAAVDWASALPPGNAKENALREFTYIWGKHDSKQSTAWLNSLPRDASRWAATEGFVFSTIDTDPDAALDWARSIPDESRRLRIISRAWSKWSNNNGLSAYDWLQSGDLSEQELDAIFSN